MTASKPRLVAVCPDNCGVHVDSVGEAISATVIEMRERGAGAPAIHKRIKEMGFTRLQGSVSTHLKHLKDVDDAPAAANPENKGKRATDLEILDEIIVSGFRNSKSWKPTIKDTLDAMKLKAQLTGSSAFEDMLAMMDSALDLAEEPEVENAAALGLADELPEEEDLPEPLVG
jgi:hypothetical protein